MHPTTAPNRDTAHQPIQAGSAPASWMEIIEKTVTRADALTAIVGGARTVPQLADQLGVRLHPVLRTSLELSAVLTSLLCDGLTHMRVIDGQWHHVPTTKGRAQAAATGADKDL